MIWFSTLSSYSFVHFPFYFPSAQLLCSSSNDIYFTSAQPWISSSNDTPTAEDGPNSGPGPHAKAYQYSMPAQRKLALKREENRPINSCYATSLLVSSRLGLLQSEPFIHTKLTLGYNTWRFMSELHPFMAAWLVLIHLMTLNNS